MTPQEVLDYLKQYIDKKIDSLDDSVKNIFDNYGVKRVSDNIDDVRNYADTYLGSKDAEPTTRNDGTPLQAGDLYFDTNINVFKVYSGTSWLQLQGGLFADKNKGVSYMFKQSLPDEKIVIPENTNAYSVDSYELVGDAEIIIPASSTYKIL